MAIVNELAKDFDILTEGYTAAVDLSSAQYCGVVPSGASSGKMKVALPGGQGVFGIGILQNAPASGKEAEVREEGISRAKAGGAFNSGIELTVSGTTGKFEAAASGDYVYCISREASSAANHTVCVRIVSPYQKN